ncbi:hypothetical protein SVAN01_06476 [Stagonosporopsis vannaccii]|nr:hypothetical protein SVAN01_06476 [Stagonosporopsis vannaccii]
MFKAQVLRRSFSVFNRVPTSRIVQSAARDGHESITIHRVRIQRPFLSRQRLVGAVAIAIATYGLGHYLGLEVEIEEEEDQDKKPGRWRKHVRKEDGTLEEVDDQEANEEEDEDEDENNEDEDEDEYDDAILFLPTGFSRRKQTTYYKGSDPEWQEFKKVSGDKKRIERIRQELVNMVRTSFSTPAIVAKIGEVDHKKGRVWIEFKFPDGPPPEYERPGYELTEDLEWRKATRDVESIHHQRLNRIFWPNAAAGALYEDTKRRATQTWNDFAVYMGWAEKTEHLTVQQMMQQVASSSTPTSSAASPATTASTSPFGTSLPAATQQPATHSPSSAAGSAKDLGFPLLDPKAVTLDLGKFRQELQKANKPNIVIPRGAFGVYALIEIYGSRARLTLNVVGIYDPKLGRYVGLSAGIWNQVAHRQSPKGGP